MFFWGSPSESKNHIKPKIKNQIKLSLKNALVFSSTLTSVLRNFMYKEFKVTNKVHVKNVCVSNRKTTYTVKLSYNEQLGSGHFCSL